VRRILIRHAAAFGAMWRTQLADGREGQSGIRCGFALGSGGCGVSGGLRRMPHLDTACGGLRRHVAYATGRRQRGPKRHQVRVCAWMWRMWRIWRTPPHGLQPNPNAHSSGRCVVGYWRVAKGGSSRTS
jgi:hypothetical protein